MPTLPFAAYPGHVDFSSTEELRRNVAAIMVEQVIRGLTVQPGEVKLPSEPSARDIVFKGTFEEVNRFFYNREWSDGLPVVPPTIEKIKEFLRYTGRNADEVIGVFLPDNRESTIWNVAVNGVMAGCRPEYMPVLIAMIEVMADPKFGQEHLGQTPGTEVLVTVNGPVIKALGFNYEQGALRVGYQANTSIGRFWRLYLRNVAGFLPHKTDKGCFGGTWRVVLAENEDAAAKIGWTSLGVDRGFSTTDSVVTVSSCTERLQALGVGAAKAEDVLDKISDRIMDAQLFLSRLRAFIGNVCPTVIMSPCVAEAIAKAGYTKEMVRQYFFEHTKFRVKPGEQLGQELKDSDAEVPLVLSPEDFLIIVSGDPGRDHCLICAQNGMIGYPVSKKIEMQ